MNTIFSRSAIQFRRGMAPLEFIMGLPFLLLLFSFIFSLGFAFLNKTTVAIEARNEVWKGRDDKAHWGNDAMSVWTAMKPDSGAYQNELTKNTRISKWLGGSLDVRSKAAVLTGTWDSRQFGVFDEGDPHLRIVEKMLGGSGNITQFVDAALHKLLTLSLDDPDGAIQAANDDKNDAEKKRDEKIKEMEEKIDQLKQELQKLKDERLALQKEYDAFKAQRDALKAKQEDLRAQAEKLPLGSPERQNLLNQASALDGQISDLETKMAAKNQQIKAKDREIEAKQKEIDIYQSELDKAKEEMAKMQ